MTQRASKSHPQDIEATGLVSQDSKPKVSFEIEDQPLEVKIVPPQDYLYFYSYTDLDRPSNFYILALIRLVMCIFCTKAFVYPDEYWQATEVAYDMVYGGVGLTWEWQPDARIRSVLYPFYLSLPLRALKVLHLDYYFAVRASYYVAQWVLVLVGDWYFYQIGKKIMGEQATRITLYLYLTNCFYNIYIIRCFGNSMEALFFVILYYYYLNITKDFNSNMVIFTILMCFSFMIRCTSPLGWVPLLLYKVVVDRALVAFIKSFVVVALPTLVALTFIDSVYYQQLTLVPYEFLYTNLVENVSIKFGVSSRIHYFLVSIPNAFNFSIAILVLGIWHQVRECYSKRQFPALLILTLFYLLFLSMVPHKEDRFVAPMMPFLMLMAGDLLSKRLKTLGFIIKLYILIIVVSETMLFLIHSNFHAQSHVPLQKIMEQDSHPHSVFHSYRLYVPAHSWLHAGGGEEQTKLLYSSRLDGTVGEWGGTAFDYTNPTQNPFLCTELLGSIVAEEFRPKYVVWQEKECRINTYCNEVCYQGLINSGYEKIYSHKALPNSFIKFFKIYQNNMYVFKLDDTIEPIA